MAANGHPMGNLLDNEDLYHFLVRLESSLRKNGRSDLAAVVANALAQAASLSTEFLGESRIALRLVKRDGVASLTSTEHQELLEVLKQLDSVFGWSK